MLLSKAELVTRLKDILSVVEADDSMEGSLSYSWLNTDMFEVECSYRIGNSQGQGGVVLLQHSSKEPDVQTD